MDTLRGVFGEYTEANVYEPEVHYTLEDDVPPESPPPVIGQDDRRMQVRVYNLWTSLLGDRPFPSIADLEIGRLPDFDPWSVLLDVSEGFEAPRVRYLGTALAAESEIDPAIVHNLADVPGRSLLSRITDHYMQIIANQAPIGFEAECVNQRGRTLLYRGILLPFSRNDESTEIDLIYGVINWKELADQQTTDELMLAIDQALESRPPAREAAALTTWADGPAHEPDDVLELETLHVEPLPEWPSNQPDVAASPGGLSGLLAAARELADAAKGSEERTRHALYAAIGRAYDFVLAARKRPEDLAALIEEAGLTMQQRAPLLPLVKLVFGADYDKTRLTEFASALCHAQRIGLAAGGLAGYLGIVPGGLKGMVQSERLWRQQEMGANAGSRSPRATIDARLRGLPTRPLHDISAQGQEFTLVLARRTESGEVVMVGEVGDDQGLLERAAQHLLGRDQQPV
ncbi:MAG: hypothetical protein V4579_11105 [Pseudomonadota bacterium]